MPNKAVITACDYRLETIKNQPQVMQKSPLSGQTCGQRRKMGLFNPERKEEQARYVYCENARFREDLRGNKRKSEVRLNLRFWSE